MREYGIGEYPHTEPVSATQRFGLFLENLRDIQSALRGEEYERSGNSGTIVVDTDSNNGKLMLVNTDTGALVCANRELATERLSACVALSIQGPGLNFLIHLTPSSELGYYHYRQVKQTQEAIVTAQVHRILEPLAQAVDLNSCHGLIVVNQGDNVGGPYDQSKVSEAWLRLKDKLEEAGLKDVVMGEPLPLDEVTLYYSPQEPDKLFVGGNDVNSENPKQPIKKQFLISIKSGKLQE